MSFFDQLHEYREEVLLQRMAREKQERKPWVIITIRGFYN